jgi:hypothetical protein
LNHRWVPSLRLAPEGEFSNFVEGLGPGQIVGRQALASPNLGDIQLSLCDRKSNLEVEVIRARGLQAKQASKLLPGLYSIFRNLLSLKLINTQINSALRQSISRQRKKMYRKSQNGDRQKNFRPIISATVAFQ